MSHLFVYVPYLPNVSLEIRENQRMIADGSDLKFRNYIPKIQVCSFIYMPFDNSIYLLRLPIGAILDFNKRITIGNYSTMSLVPFIGVNPIPRCISMRCPFNDYLVIKCTIFTLDDRRAKT